MSDDMNLAVQARVTDLLNACAIQTENCTEGDMPGHKIEISGEDPEKKIELLERICIHGIGVALTLRGQMGGLLCLAQGHSTVSHAIDMLFKEFGKDLLSHSDPQEQIADMMEQLADLIEATQEPEKPETESVQ